MHQLLIFAAVGALATRVGSQLSPFAIVLSVLAAEILAIGYRQRQASAGGGAKEQLGMADASRINYFSQMVYKNPLTLNIFKLHFTRKLIYKYINIY